MHISASAVPAWLARCLDEPAIYFRDKRLSASLRKLCALIERDAPFQDLAIASLTDLIIVELAGRRAEGRHREAGESDRRPTVLGADKVALVRSYIHQNLSANITLEDLAGVVSFSRFYFVRAYKAATGRSP